MQRSRHSMGELSILGATREISGALRCRLSLASCALELYERNTKASSRLTRGRFNASLGAAVGVPGPEATPVGDPGGPTILEPALDSALGRILSFRMPFIATYTAGHKRAQTQSNYAEPSSGVMLWLRCHHDVLSPDM